MNFQKLFIFTLAGIALSGFSTLPNGVNAASIEDRDATMRGGTETTWIISVPSNFTCEQVSPETFLLDNIDSNSNNHIFQVHEFLEKVRNCGNHQKKNINIFFVDADRFKSCL